MRENRSYGSEGGGAELNRPSLPLSELATAQVFFFDFVSRIPLKSRTVL
jgi:hypothetical protein